MSATPPSDGSGIEPSTTHPPFSTGDVDMLDEVYDLLQPLDGFPKGSRGGPRPYSITWNDRRWWVVVSLSDFGDLIVGQWGPIQPKTACEASDG